MGLLDFLSGRERKARVGRAAQLYAAAVAQARQPAFYAALGVPDTLEGRFELIVLHVHLLCRRLGRLGAEGGALAQAMFDTMFHDMDRNLRELGVGDPSIPHRIKAMLEAYYGRISAYESAMVDGQDALARAIARNVYGAEAAHAVTAHADHAPNAAALAGYVVAAAERLESAAPADLMAGRVPFPPAPER